LPAATRGRIYLVKRGIAMSPNGASLMSGIPELLLLRLLARQEMYGYEIARALRVTTREAITLGESVLYPALHALEQRRFLASRRRVVEGRARVYYRVTAAGHRRLEKLTRDWHRIAGAVETTLQEPSHG
jgi:PadR family transcriptional regulator, regulatory protein PadR